MQLSDMASAWLADVTPRLMLAAFDEADCGDGAAGEAGAPSSPSPALDIVMRRVPADDKVMSILQSARTQAGSWRGIRFSQALSRSLSRSSVRLASSSSSAAQGEAAAAAEPAGAASGAGTASARTEAQRSFCSGTALQESAASRSVRPVSRRLLLHLLRQFPEPSAMHAAVFFCALDEQQQQTLFSVASNAQRRQLRQWCTHDSVLAFQQYLFRPFSATS